MSNDKWPMDICRRCRFERQTHLYDLRTCAEFQETFDDSWNQLLDKQEAELDAMTDEQQTLFLARLGRSPEDVRRSWERLQRLMAEPNPTPTARTNEKEEKP